MIELKTIIDSFYHDIAMSGIEEYHNYLTSIAKGNLYRYNVNNQILIYKQQPEAEVVASYSVWKENGYVPKRHSAIYADEEDKICGMPYLFSADKIVGLSREEIDKFSWKLEGDEVQIVNDSFLQKKEQLPETLMEASKICFQEIEEEIFAENFFARKLAEYAANTVILQRCGYQAELPEYIRERFENLEEKEKIDLVKKIQPYAAQFSRTILGNIGALVAYRKERNKNEQSGQEEFDRAGVDRGREEAVRESQDTRRNSTDSGFGTGRQRGAGTGAAIEKTERKRRIEDFGEKIGGARKDLWAKRGLMLEDILVMNEAEQEKYINKNQVWPKPDYEEMKKDGLPIEVIYFCKKVRDSLPVNPVRSKEKYVTLVSDIKQETMKCRNMDDIGNVYTMLMEKKYVIPVSSYRLSVGRDYDDIITNKLLRSLQMNDWELKREIQKKRFLYTDEEKILADYNISCYDESHTWSVNTNGKPVIEQHFSNGKRFIYPQGEFARQESWKIDTWYVRKGSDIVGFNFETLEQAQQYVIGQERDKIKNEKKEKTTSPRKKKWVPPILEHIERMGLEDVCQGRMIEGKDFLDEFAIRGGEFGNWLTEQERQANLNMAYEAFCDLAEALNISRKDISLNGQLAIAFGARGRGNALAHFEETMNVINLTKMKGAGSLSHEWGHALDFISRDILGGKSEERTKISDVLKWKYQDGKRVKTDFYHNSEVFDQYFCKNDKGYWSSDDEMFARAFACYVTDKLAELGGKSDYLNGHAQLGKLEVNGKIIHAYPTGKERETINQAMDYMIDSYRNRGLLHEPENSLVQTIRKSR